MAGWIDLELQLLQQGGSRNVAEKTLATKPSNPEHVDAYMKKLKHPLKGVVEALREAILGTDREIGEEIKMERAIVLLCRTNETVQPEGVQAIYRGFQSVSENR